jgi:hypothetical protein
MDTNKINEAFTDTFSGLTMYYRDVDLSQELISKYEIDKTIMERGFVDVSAFAEGLQKNLRFAIASSKARYLGEINPDVAKYKFCLISAPSFYRVMDIYKIGEQTQVFLLHFDEKYLDILMRTKTNFDEKIIKMARDSFDKKIKMHPSTILNDEFWTDRTKHPIGMSGAGEFFPLNTDYLKNIKISNQEEEVKEKSSNSTLKKAKPEAKKKGFWKRLFE